MIQILKLLTVIKLINLDDAFKKDIITSYLDEKQYFSFNSQELDKFKNSYLITPLNYPAANNYLYLIIFPILSLAILYRQSLINNLFCQLKIQIQEHKNGKRKKTI